LSRRTRSSPPRTRCNAGDHSDLADIDPATHNLDPAAVWRMITPPHRNYRCAPLGRRVPVKELEAIAKEHNLRLMFDASHGFGCSLNGKLLGGFGECEVFSFHATKFFTPSRRRSRNNNDVLAEEDAADA